METETGAAGSVCDSERRRVSTFTWGKVGGMIFLILERKNRSEIVFRAVSKMKTMSLVGLEISKTVEGSRMALFC